MSTHRLRVKWSRQMGDKRSYASGPVGRKSTIHIPVQVGPSLVGEEINAIEVSRHSRVNGAIHATGYRIRSYDCPYDPGDFGIVQSTGDNRLLLFDPKTGTASVEAKILENSSRLRGSRRISLEGGTSGSSRSYTSTPSQGSSQHL